jgi:filamentous hemagglutinin family protein
MKSPGKPGFAKRCALAFLLLLSSDGYIPAAPRGGHVVSGTASFTQDGNLTVITAGNRSIINFQSFNISSNEIVRFVQPSASATVLDRVLGAAPTNIFGQLQANGIVVIVNPYGVYFRNGSVLNLGGLYAGAGQIANADFAAGNIHFTDLTGDVRNDGVVAADNQIALMGANVFNAGSIISAHGTAVLASGPDVYVGTRHGNIFVQANGKAVGSAAPKGSVVNSGTVAAPRVLLGAGDLYSTAIVNSGLLQGRNIAVDAGRHGTAKISGRLDASSAKNPSSTGKGGSIEVLGGQVALQGATLDANGASGGGSVRVGGDLHGGGTMLHAATTSVDAKTTIDADATGKNGNGGSVVLWSDRGTLYSGAITARAGSRGGNGGWVEVSSHGLLGFYGHVNADAAAGKPGSLLLDPMNIEIVAGDGSGMTTAGDAILTPTGTIGVAATTGGNSFLISQDALQGLAGGTNIHLEATHDIRIDALTGGVLTLAAGAGTVQFDANAGTTIPGGTATYGSFVMASQTDMIMASGRNVTITAGAPGGNGTTNSQGGINPEPFSILAGNIDTSNSGGAGGNVTFSVGTGLTGLHSSDVQVGTITTTGGDGAGGSVTVNALSSYTNTSGQTYTFSGVLPSSVSLGAISAGGSTTGGAIVVGAQTSGTGVTMAPGTIALNGVITGGSLTINNATSTTTFGGNVTTTAGQTYSGAVLLSQANTTFYDDSAAGMTFAKTVDGVTAGANALTLSGSNVTFDGAVGAAMALKSLTTTGTTTAAINGGSVVTSGTAGQFYDDTVTLGPAGLLTTLSAGTAPILFDATVIGAAGTSQGLTLSTSGLSGFGGPAGTTARPLGSLTTIGGGEVTIDNGVTTAGGGGQSYSGTVELGGALPRTTITLTANGGGGILFASGVGGNPINAAGSTSLNLITAGTTRGAITFDGAVGTTAGPATVALDGLTTSAGTTVNIDGGSVTTDAGGQSYGGPVVLGATTATTLSDAGSGAISFADTINGSSAMGASAQALHVVTAGAITYGGTVGSTALPLASLANTGTGTVEIDGGAVTTSGSQTYDAAVTLGQATTLTGTALVLGAGVTVDGSGSTGPNSNGASSNSLTLDFSNAVMVSGSVGAAPTGVFNNIDDFTSEGSGGTVLAGDFETVHSQTYVTPVTLSTGVTLKSDDGGNIQFEGTLDGTTVGSQALTVNTAGTTEFDGAVGGTALASLATTGTGPVEINGGAIATTGDQTYDGAVSLGQTATLTGGALMLAAGVTVDGGGLSSLTLDLSAAVTVTGSVGATPTGIFNNIDDFTSEGSGGTILAGDFETVHSQTFTNDVTLSANATLKSDNGGSIRFASLVGGTTAGGQGLTVNTGGTTEFDEAVGRAALPLASLATTGAGGVDLKGGVITTEGTLGQSFLGPVTLGTSTTLTDLGTGPITFNASISGSTEGGQALTLTTPGTVTFGGAVGSTALRLASVVTTGAGVVHIDGSTVITTGATGQSYGGPVVLDSTAMPALTQLAAGSGPITFTSTVTGATAGQGLSVASTQNTFGGAVGSAGTPLGSLADIGSGPVEINGGSITTSGSQTYDSAVHLGQTTTLTGSALVLSVGITVNGAGSLGINSNGANSNSLTLDFSSPVTVTGSVGASPNGIFNNIFDFTSEGSNGTKLAGNFETVNTQTYATAVTLSTGVTLTSDGSAGSIFFEGTVGGTTSGGQSLTINNNGITEFEEAVGSTGLPLASLAITSRAGVLLYGAQVFTSGALGQNYGGAVTIYSLGTLTTLTAGSGPVRFGSNVAGSAQGQALSIGTTGAITFGGAVGTPSIPLESLVTTGTGTVHLDGSTVMTNGALGQSYGGPVELDSAGMSVLTTLTAGAGPVTFVSTVAGGTTGQALSVGTTGQITFGGAVGSAATPLASLATTGTGVVELNGGSVTTTGNQTYDGDVHLGATTTLTGTMLALATTVNGAGSLGINSNGLASNSLTLDFSTPVTVTGGTTAGGGPSGTFNNIDGFTSEGSGGTILAGDFETVHSQTYTTAVTLMDSSTLTSDKNGAITFHSVDGAAADAQSLIVNTGGVTAFDGLVGSNFALHALTTDNEGAAGEQTQFNISLTNQPAGTVGVNVGTGGITINDPVVFNIADNTVPARSSVSVETAGGQIYAGAATLALDTVLTNTGGGNITFGATVDGQHNLTLNTAGNEIFHGQVGAGSPLLSLTTDANPADRGGATVFDVTSSGNTVTTVNIAAPGGTATGGQTYNDAVILEQATTLSSIYKGSATMGGAVEFVSTVDSVGATPANLTVLAGAGQTVIGPDAVFHVAKLNLGGAQVTFDAPVGATHPLNILTVGQNAAAGSPLGSIDINNGGFTTTLGQTYSVPVILSANTVLADTNAQAIVFQSTVDGDGFLARSLTLDTAGTVTFKGVIGGSNPLQSLLVTAGAGTFFDLAVAAGAGVTVGSGGIDIEGPATFDITGVGLGGLVHPAVETTGAQVYDGSLTLSQDTSLYGAGTGNIQFNGPVDGGFALILNGAGNEIFTGTVGGVTPLASLSVDALLGAPAGQTQFLMAPASGDAGVRVGAGGVTIDNGVLFGATGSTLAAPTVLTFAGGTQTYRGLAVVAANTVLVGDASGTQPPVGGAYNGGGAILFGAGVTGTGGANLSIFTGAGATKFQAAVAARTLAVTGANVTFDGAVNGLGAFVIAPNGGAAGGPIDLDGATVATAAGQTYGSPVVLGTDTLLTDSGNGSLIFNSNATVDGAHALTLATGGLTVFDALVGSQAALTALTSSDAAGTTQFNMNAAGAKAGVLISGPVTVNGSAIFNTAGTSLTVPSILTLQNGAQTYGGTLNLETTTFLVSASGLPAAGAGFTGGGVMDFTSTQGITSTGGQDFYVRAGAGTDTFGSTINVRRLDLGGAAATFDGPITLGGLLSVEPNSGGITGLLKLNGGAITTAGSQTYNAGIILGATTTLTSLDSAGDGGNIVFNSTIDSGPQRRALTVNTPGDEVFLGIVGGNSELASLATDAAGAVGGTARFEMTVSAASAGVAGVNVAGAITIHDAADFDVSGSTLAASGPLSVSSGGAQTYDGPVTLTLVTSLASANTAGDGGNIVFQSTVDSGGGGARGLAVSTPGNEVFNGIVGGGAALASLTTDVVGASGGAARFGMDITGAPAGTAGVNVQGAVAINDAVNFDVLGSSVAPGGPVAVSTGGAQSYLGAATLSADTSLASSGGGALTFASTVNGAQGLALSTSGAELFTGVIGGTTALTSLSATGGSVEFDIDLKGSPAAPAAVSVAGPITIAAPVTFDVTDSTAQQPTVLTSGSFAQTYGKAVTLLQATVLESSGQGGLIFNSTVNGGFALTLSTAGAATFNAPVGSGAALLSLSLANPAGLAALNGGTISTLEGQTFAGRVELTAETTLASQDKNDLGAITFERALNDPKQMPGRYGLTVLTAAGTTFKGAIGNISPLASLTTDMPGTTMLDGLSVATTGSQSYGDAVELGNNASLTAGTGAITFAQTVNASSPFALSLRSPLVLFDGAVGMQQPLSTVTVAPGDTLQLSGGSVTTTRSQTYGGEVELKKSADLASTMAGAITFDAAVNGPGALTVATAGDTFFDGPVGQQQALNFFTTGPGAAYFGNGMVATIADQTYGGAVHLKADADFTSTKGTVAFRQSVDGTHALAISSADETIFAGEVSQLTGLTIAGSGRTEFSGGNVQITGPQVYEQPVTLNQNTTLAGSAITFQQMVNGPLTLTLTATGKTTFDQAVNVADVTTGATGTTVFNADVTTTGAQLYGNAATLGSSSIVLASPGTITFANTIDGDAAGAGLILAAGSSVLNGDVGKTAPLSTLDVKGGLTVTSTLVQTTGLQHYEQEVSLNAPASATTDLTSSRGDLLFGGNVTALDGVVAKGYRIAAQGNITTNGNLDLETETAAGRPPALLLLAGSDYASNNGNVLFNAGSDSTPSTTKDYSTIVLSSTGQVTIKGNDFTMGYLQKLVDLGSLNINVARGTATIGDIAARNNLRIAAAQVVLLNRPAEQSASGAPDDALSVDAGLSIDFGGAQIRFANSANRTANFVTTTDVTTINRIQGISLFKDANLLSLFPKAAAFDLPDADASLLAVANPPQPSEGGEQSLDTAAALSGALPDQKPLEVTEDITISASQMEELKKLGIHPRLAQRNERRALASKRALFAQLVDGQDMDNYGLLQPIKGGVSRLQPSDYVVVVDRMGETEVQSILAAFEQLYGKNKEKATEIGAAFQTAFTDYTVQKQTADPAGFSPYLQSLPGKYPAIQTAVRGFDNLFGHIEHLGLTDKEVAKSEEHIASDLGVSGVSPEDMVNVINSLRKELPPAQKAGSNSAPPSAPAGNPAPGATAPAPAKAPPPPSKTVRAYSGVYQGDVAQR